MKKVKRLLITGLAIFLIVCFVIFLMIVVPSKQTQNLTTEEQAIKSAVAQNQAEAFELLENLVNINSNTVNLAGVKAVADIVAKELEALGFDIRWEKPDGVNRAAHLFASREGGMGKRVLLIAHADTVYAENSEFQKFSRDEYNAYGPGVSDSKGGIVVIIQALKALKQAGRLEDSNITVAISSDEENVGEPALDARVPLIKAAEASNYVLAFESSGDFSEVMTARRGMAYWQLNVKNEDALDLEDASYENDFMFSVNFIVGGTAIDSEAGHAFGKGNVIPQKTVATGVIQCDTRSHCQQIQTEMEAMISQTDDRSVPTEVTMAFNTDEAGDNNSLSWQLITEGQGGYSAKIFPTEYGRAAIFEMARILSIFTSNITNKNDAILSSASILSNFEQALMNEGNYGLTFNTGVTAGGTEVAFGLETSIANVSGKSSHAQQAISYGEIRYLSQEQCEKTQQQMDEIVAAANTNSRADTTADLEFVTICKPSMPVSDGNEALLKKLNHINGALGYGEVSAMDVIKLGTADINYVADLDNIEGGLDGLGPVGGHSHSIEENMQIDSLIKATERAAILIDRLTHARR
ncbi:MAG: M20/M25/M40 family metallo-hydrolase [Gammaproteobacteria bacterium]